jgi:acetolactate synthase-1/2/3 large subunit
MDVIETESRYFAGRVGSYGDRHGNFSIQNSDLVIVLGSSLSSSVVGYKPEWFAREAKVLYVDNDPSEISKPTIRTIPIQMDLNSFFSSFAMVPKDYSNWIAKCNHWKNKWMFEMPIYTNEIINPYPALKVIFDILPENKTVVSMTGSIATLVWHMNKIKKNDKFIFNGQGDMGPDTPASIGAYLADPTKPVINIVGEGALQFNIQELQTIVHHKMPIKTIVFNNASYGAIEITQRANFKNLYGLNADSGISFPDTEKIAKAYGIHYMGVRTLDDLPKAIHEMIEYPGPVMLEIFCCVQGRYPKLSARKLPDGNFTSLPFEDMEPFLDRNEFYSEMIVKPLS